MPFFWNSTFEIALKSYHISPAFLVRAAISAEESFLQGKRQAGEK